MRSRIAEDVLRRRRDDAAPAVLKANIPRASKQFNTLIKKLEAMRLLLDPLLA